MTDQVNHPPHYTQGDIETIDFIRDKLTKEGFEGYCIGNCLKYLSRYKHKGGREDLEKANVYLGWFRDAVSNETLSERLWGKTPVDSWRSGRPCAGAGGIKEAEVRPLCEEHGLFPCAACGIKHFEGCECGFCGNEAEKK